MKTTLSKRLKNLRKEKGITQRELAEAINVSLNKITYLESQVANPDDVLLRLSEYFDVSVAYLFGKSDF